jgi:SAM-dependent methyltransferase
MMSILYSKNPNKFWLKILILFGITVLILVIYKLFYTNNKNKEGFDQNKKYLLKRNDDIADDFFVEVYDVIHPPESRVETQINAILQMTQPSKESSAFLDVGSKTGAVVDTLFDKGYRVYGVDKSNTMVNYSKKMYPSISVSCGDIQDSMLYEKATFTHILCLNYNIYNFQDKTAFFKNCSHWLKSGGVVIVHLVDKQRFNATIPASIPYNPFNWGFIQANFSDNFKETPKKERSLKTTADFRSFTYDAEYDVQPKSNQVLFREKFTDKESSNIRENESTLYMEEMGEIINDAIFCNFIVQGKLSLSDINGGDPNQFLYIFERSD